MAGAYSFELRWTIAASPARCWREIERMLRPGAVSWWPGFSIEDAPAEVVVGSVVAFVVRAPAGYRLRARVTLTDVDPDRRLAAVSGGDLRGTGSLDIMQAPGGSVLTWRWDVATEKTWMNATAFALRPLFAWAHERVMSAGERGLRAAVLRDP